MRNNRLLVQCSLLGKHQVFGAKKLAVEFEVCFVVLANDIYEFVGVKGFGGGALSSGLQCSDFVRVG